MWCNGAGNRRLDQTRQKKTRPDKTRQGKARQGKARAVIYLRFKKEWLLHDGLHEGFLAAFVQLNRLLRGGHAMYQHALLAGESERARKRCKGNRNEGKVEKERWRNARKRVREKLPVARPGFYEPPCVSTLYIYTQLAGVPV
jgi:hypothetical protein